MKTWLEREDNENASATSTYARASRRFIPHVRDNSFGPAVYITLGIMSNPAQTQRPQAVVGWGDLVWDVLALFVGALSMGLSFVLDACLGEHNYFARSGAIAALLSAVVAFWSLNKHYRKFLNYSQLSDVPFTSQNQRTVDRLTLALSIGGTVVWAYGDIIFRKVWQ